MPQSLSDKFRGIYVHVKTNEEKTAAADFYAKVSGAKNPFNSGYYLKNPDAKNFPYLYCVEGEQICGAGSSRRATQVYTFDQFKRKFGRKKIG